MHDPTAAGDPGVDGISSTVQPDGIRNTVRPRLRAHRPPVSSTTSRAALCLKSAGRFCCCDWASPKLCTSPPRGGAAVAAPQRRAPPRRGHARRAVCLPRRGCSPPSLFNRAGFDAKVAYRVVVAPAPVQRGGRAPRRACAVAGGRHRSLQRLGPHLPRLSSLDRPRSAFLCGAAFCPLLC